MKWKNVVTYGCACWQSLIWKQFTISVNVSRVAASHISEVIQHSWVVVSCWLVTCPVNDFGCIHVEHTPMGLMPVMVIHKAVCQTENDNQKQHYSYDNHLCFDCNKLSGVMDEQIDKWEIWQWNNVHVRWGEVNCWIHGMHFPDEVLGTAGRNVIWLWKESANNSCQDDISGIT